MKKIYLLIFGLVLLITSCDQENPGALYEPEAPYVGFSTPVVSENVLSAEDNYSVSVQIVRSDLEGTATAEVSLEMNDNIEGVFELESNTATFEDGEGKAYVKIVPLVEASQLDPTITYVFNLTLTSENASSFYNTTTYKASFKYTTLGTATFTSTFFEDEWEVEVQKLEVGNLTLYKLKHLYEAGYDVTLITEGTEITVNAQKAWYHSSYGDIYVSGGGTIDGKVYNLLFDHHVPGVGSFGEYNETLTLP